MGKLVYPSLQVHNGKGFVVLQPTEDGIYFEVHPSSVLRLNNSEVAIREGQKASIYRFHAWKKRWIQTNMAFTPYHSIGGQAYAILL